MTLRGAARRAGFTIVEMLMVIAILGALVGIVTTASSVAVKSARERRIMALKGGVKNGIMAFRNQTGYYPPTSGGRLQRWSLDGMDSDKKADYLSDADYDTLMRGLVKDCMKKSGGRPVMDPMGLIVTTSAGASRRASHGREFREAVKKGKRHGAVIPVSSMCFGYADAESGAFRRFVVRYNAETDDVRVMTQKEYKDETKKDWQR